MEDRQSLCKSKRALSLFCITVAITVFSQIAPNETAAGTLGSGGGRFSIRQSSGCGAAAPRAVEAADAVGAQARHEGFEPCRAAGRFREHYAGARDDEGNGSAGADDERRVFGLRRLRARRASGIHAERRTADAHAAAADKAFRRDTRRSSGNRVYKRKSASFCEQYAVNLRCPPLSRNARPFSAAPRMKALMGRRCVRGLYPEAGQKFASVDVSHSVSAWLNFPAVSRPSRV